MLQGRLDGRRVWGRMVTYICEIEKNGTGELICKAETDTVENNQMDTKVEREGRMS